MYKSLLAVSMPVCKFYNAISSLSSPLRCMGLDIGKKTIGIAIGDPEHKIATPKRILWRKKFTPDAHELISEISTLNVGLLVLGWPLNMDGSQGPKCDSVRDFAHAFLKLHDIPICFQDERLSTVAVEREMLAADVTRARRKQARDALAASWILQAAFDEYHNSTQNI